MTKGCYTCRRRRVVCDNGLPTCRKCRTAGKECLGYQKPLVWVKGGVASRGKMMGLSFDDVIESPRSRGHCIQQPEEGATGSPDRQEYRLEAVLNDTSLPQTCTSKIESQTVGPDRGRSLVTADPSTPTGDEHQQYIDGNDETSIVHVPARSPQSTHIPSPRAALVDPLFQDLDRLSRLYISHFNQRCVHDLALYDKVKNPYRDLIPLVAQSRVLSDVLAAVGAVHYASISHAEGSSILVASGMPVISGPGLPFQDNETSATALSQGPSSQAFEHFLRFKHRALRQLSLDLLDPITRNDDKTVAGILVLVLLDAMESGSGAWKFHLEGAKNLLRSRQDSMSDSNMRRIVEGLDTFVIDSCLILEIMGSTLARPGALSKPFYSHKMGPGILKRLEQTSWVGCPAYLLEVIFFVHAQRYSDTDLYDSESSPLNHLSSPESLLHHIQNFDPSAWAQEMQNFFFLTDLSARLALASAYKAAVYLYASRVLSKSKPNSSSSVTPVKYYRSREHSEAADELIYQLSLIRSPDPHFKCLIWPTFIAGAESKNVSQRTFALDRLQALWTAISSINVRNAAWVLGIMWQRQDERRLQREQAFTSDESINLNHDGNDDDNDDFDWIQELDNSPADWLFI
ncbi:transcriptional regulator family: Fungal Specific TF [Paecilomyces variotii]|nr:transcriptional regulator family: Fungal Specific TF [Paecilomyces variotii]KAJ9220781.1 transcriptional regulator family: Fungal Specific TF [Paecilomyces variotii]KAJ9356174.1 transcriptional regulator family: Fungal Specific TF [Paecilomyces variotii]